MKKKIINIIYDSIDEVNQQLDAEEQLDKAIDTILFGGNGKLDSLGLINLVITVEQNIEDEFDVSITLADERAMSQENIPFKDVGTLAEYIGILLDENLNG